MNAVVTKTKHIKVKDVVIDKELIIREVSQFQVNNLVQALASGNTLPPIILTKDKRLACGHHRLAAYTKYYGNDHKVEYITTTYINLKELLMLIVDDNIRHGLPLQTFEKKETALRLSNLHATKEELSALFGVTIHKMETWCDKQILFVGKEVSKSIYNTNVNRSTKNLIKKPLKRCTKHMEGKIVPIEEYEAHKKHDYGVGITAHITAILNLLKRPNWIPKDEKTYKKLKELHKAIGDYLNHN